MARPSPTLKRTYGWHPDVPDHRDHVYSIPLGAGANLPPAVDLRAFCPPIYDQGSLGSCTGNAVAGAYQYDQMAQGLPSFPPSRLFIYFNERAIEGTTKIDAGAQIRDGIKTIAKQGVCPESLWPYNVSAFTARPSKRAYDTAAKHTAVSYQRLVTLDQMRACLADKRPFVFGFSVYENFEGEEVAKTGMLSLPKPGEQLLGGHAVVGVGYNDNEKRIVVRNSWGTGWGQAGYFEMPYDYVENPDLADDFWRISTVR